MAQLNTIIQLRQGTTADWADSEVVLKIGEMGLEYLTDGTVKIKAGDGEHTWADLAYVGSDVKAANVFQVELTAGETDDIAAIEAKVAEEKAEKQDGDVAIVKALITGDKYSYTSYVYESALDVEGDNSSHGWSAMDGNYSATNVFIKNKIELAGTFDRVGNYVKGNATTGSIAAGTSLEAILSGMLQQELYPTANDKPNAEITASGNNGEVGTTYSAPTATLKITDVGSYEYGDKATGIQFAIGSVKIAEGADPATATNTKTNDAVMVKDSTLKLTAAAGGTYADTAKKYTFSGTASYPAGKVPVTNLGNAYAAAQIPAGSVTIADKEISFSGWRRIFGGGTVAGTIDSTAIRALAQLKKTTDTVPTTAGGKGFVFNAAKNSTKVIFAYPASWTSKTPKFEIFTMAWGATEGFVKSTVSVADATGTGGYKDYTVYTYTPATPLAADNTQYCVYFA